MFITMRKITLVLLALVMTAGQLFAANPMRRLFPVSQSDGTEVMVNRVGNGIVGFYATPDGWALVRNAAGDLCYACFDESGNFVASDVVAHDEAVRTAAEADYVKQSAITASDAFNRLTQPDPNSVRKSRLVGAPQSTGLGIYGQSAGSSIPSIGEVVIPVIMVEFPDLPFTLASEKSLDEQMNGENYRDSYGSVGSLRQYFIDNSYGMFTPEYRVVGRMMAQYNHDYYGAHGSNGSNDGRMIDLVIECLDFLTAQGLDTEPFLANGRIPMLSIYYAGEGEQSAFGADAEGFIWAHQAGLNNAYISGTPVNAYLATNELLGVYNGSERVSTQLTGVGVYAHEFCHGLGLPDVYDINYTGITGMDYWSLMDLGEHWNNGYTPVGLTAYERCFLGWLEVETLTEPGVYELNKLTDEEGTRAYRIVNPRSRDGKEYYILENRQLGTKWFPSTMGHGMLVYHIFYDENSWISNHVNTEARRPRYTYIPADNAKGHVDDYGYLQTNWIKGDLYPGLTSNHELTDESTPAADVYLGGNGMGQPILDISERRGVVSFTFIEDPTVGIDNVVMDGDVTVYTLDGRRLFDAPSVSAARMKLSKGLYLLKSASGTQKLLVE